ncbi:hypothetical protein PT974_04822 [Cladobotryum mycophilum]|uniref:Uncharacterized protein n=1 Tax=Cladobotryum mycophilum TaxID=491253 RepID=A0ABR0SQA0_9HYPO
MPLTDPMQPPPIFMGLTPKSILDETKSIIIHSNMLCDRIVSTLTPATASFSNVARPTVDDMNRAACCLKILGTLLAEVSPDPLIRDASRGAQKLILAAGSESIMRRDVAALVGSVYNRSLLEKDDQLDAQDRHLFNHLQGRFLRSGSTLQNEEKRRRLQGAQAELHDLRIAAQKTLSDSNDGVWFSRIDLAGMSMTVIDSLKVRDDTDGQDIAGVTYFVTFKGEHATQMWLHMQNEASRRRY